MNPELLRIATPRNGHLRHIVVDHEVNRLNNHHWLTRSRALCGVSGKDAWGNGWMKLSTEDLKHSDCHACTVKANIIRIEYRP